MNYQCAKVSDGLIKGFKLFVFLSRPLNVSKDKKNLNAVGESTHDDWASKI